MTSKRVAWFLCVSGAAIAAAAAVVLFSPATFRQVIELAAAVKQTAVRDEWPPRLRSILLELLFAGTVLAGAGAALLRARQLTGYLASPFYRIGTAAAIVVFVQGVSAWHRKSAIFDGQRIWFLDDDAMISLRYASNLASGNGLVWNIGDRVEGYSNFLWTCLMAAIHWLGISPEMTSAAVLGTNVALSCTLLILVDQLSTALGVPATLTAATLFLVALSREVLVWSLSGLETIALAVLCTLALSRVVSTAKTRDDSVTYIALAVLPLIRADAIVLAGLIAATSLAVHRDLPRVLKLGAAAAFPFIVHLGVRHHYYGEWLPNTAYLKVGGWDDRLLRGISYVWNFLTMHVGAVLLMAVAALKGGDPRYVVLAGLFMLYGGYILYLGGDAFPEGRFFVPLVPAMFAVAMAGAASIHSAVARRWAVVALIAGTPLFWQNRYWQPLPAFWTALDPSPADVGNVAIGRWLRDHTSRDSSIADYWAGSVFYFSGRRGVDLLGKMDPVIARMPVVCQDGVPGHNKYNFAHSLAVLQPDFVVAGFKVLEDGSLRGPSGERLPERDPSPCHMFGALYRDAYFRSHYLPYVANNEGWRTIFKRTGGGEH